MLFIDFVYSDEAESMKMYSFFNEFKLNLYYFMHRRRNILTQGGKKSQPMSFVACECDCTATFSEI